jgi:hypothetical protein
MSLLTSITLRAPTHFVFWMMLPEQAIPSLKRCCIPMVPWFEADLRTAQQFVIMPCEED